MLERLKKEFIRLFHNLDNTRCFFSPGRVNIIGEHIDYNGGYVMPCSIDRGTYFIMRKNNTNVINVYSVQFEELGLVSFDIKDDSKNKSWVDYVKGAIKHFNIDFGFDLVVGGTIPHSSGLSSSASFCTGIGYGLTSLDNRCVSGKELALKCKDIENFFMGVNCGIMDQFIVANGENDMAMLLDCNTLKYELVPFELNDYVLIIANTNKKRKLSDSKYNERKAECEEALSIINKKYNYSCLCAIKEDELNDVLKLLDSDVLKRRVRHVVMENVRTIKACTALKSGDILTLGKLLTESHISLDKDYEVTGIELNALAYNFMKEKGCIGARMTGAGFGGCSIALIKKGFEDAAIANIKALYIKEIGYEPSFYVVNVSGHTREI